MTTEIVRRDFVPFTDVDLSGVQTLAKALLESGYFRDVRTVAEVGVKIIAGAELGLGPAESMRALYTVDGKIEFTAEFLAQRIRLSDRYDYRILELENDRCSIEFTRDDKVLGVSTFTDEDRQRAGLSLETSGGKATPWAKYPRNLFFARALTNGVAWFASDVVAGVPGMRSITDAALRDDDIQELPASIVRIGEDPAADGEAAGVGAQAAPASPDAVAAPVRDRKATKAQLSKLVLLAHEHGWDDDERHRRAGVETFKDLTKSAAHALIEAWAVSEVPGETPADGDSERSAVSDSATAEVSPSAPGPPQLDPDAPASETFMLTVRKHIGGTRGPTPESAVLILVRKFFEDVKRIEDITNGQLAIAFDAYLRRGECTHPVDRRESGGFCRHCGQMVGAA